MPQRLVTRIGKVVTRSICLYLSNPSHIVCKQCLHMDYLRDPSSVSDFLCLRSFCTYLVYIYNICARVFKYIYIYNIYIYIYTICTYYFFSSPSPSLLNIHIPQNTWDMSDMCPKKKRNVFVCVFSPRSQWIFWARPTRSKKRNMESQRRRKLGNSRVPGMGTKNVPGNSPTHPEAWEPPPFKVGNGG